MMQPNVCILCSGRNHAKGEELYDALFQQPDEKHGDATLRGWLCDECMVVHWAWHVNATQ